MQYLFIFLVSCIISLIAAFFIIPLFKKIQKEGQPIREDGPKAHLKTKKGTPTMGGVIILIGTLITTLFFTEVTNNLLIMFFVTISYAIIGGVDDYKKLSKTARKGISAKQKLILQFIVAIVTVYFLSDDVSTLVSFPIFNYDLNLGWLYYPLAVLAIVSYSNAVNVTDGLDGLAIIPIIIATVSLMFISLGVNSDVFVLALSLVGASIVFFMFNAYPAQIFMGDVASLSIGALLGVMSIILKHEVVFIVISGLFVIEALSVVLQVYYYKLTGGKRLFRMAPIHHHFEHLGWHENKVVVRFWFFALVCAFFGMSIR